MEQKNTDRNENQNLVRFETYADLVSAVVNDGYTMTSRQVCRLLKIHRPWYNTNIRPFVKYTYVTNSFRGDGFSNMDLITRLRQHVRTRSPLTRIGCTLPDGSEDPADRYSTTLIQRKSVFDCICAAAWTATRQTISLPLKCLFPPEEFKRICYIFVTDENWQKDPSAIDTIIAKHAPEVKNLLDKRAFLTKRSRCVPVPVEVPPLDEDNFLNVISSWVAPRDLKEYGDTDESVARRFFEAGAIRLEGHFTSADGVIAKKVLYKFPEDTYYGVLYPYGGPNSIVLLPYSFYLENQAIKDRLKKLQRNPK